MPAADWERSAWCPRAERDRAQAAYEAATARERTRVLFRDFCADYLAWAKLHHKGYATDVSRVAVLRTTFGPLRLDEITAAAVDAFLAKLLTTRRSSTCIAAVRCSRPCSAARSAMGC